VRGFAKISRRNEDNEGERRKRERERERERERKREGEKTNYAHSKFIIQTFSSPHFNGSAI